MTSTMGLVSARARCILDVNHRDFRGSTEWLFGACLMDRCVLEVLKDYRRAGSNGLWVRSHVTS
jgi:hypothetical protein